MKTRAIIHIGKNVAKPGQLVKYIYRDGALYCCGGQLPGGVTGNAKQDYESLILGHHGSGRLLRSLIVSLDCPSTDESVKMHSAALGQCCADFCKRFAPDSHYLYGVHRQGKKIHAHLLVCNSDGEKCLEWGRDVLREMQGFGWTVEFETGRGKGKNQVVGKTCYPGKNTVAAKLAGMAVEELKSLLDVGDLVVTRKRKDGSPVSLTFEGRKLRVQSICAVDPDFAGRLLEAMLDNDGDDGYIQKRLKNRDAKQIGQNRGRIR